MRPGPPRFSRSSAYVYYTECKLKNKKQRRPWNEAIEMHMVTNSNYETWYVLWDIKNNNRANF